MNGKLMNVPLDFVLEFRSFLKKKEIFSPHFLIKCFLIFLLACFLFIVSQCLLSNVVFFEIGALSTILIFPFLYELIYKKFKLHYVTVFHMFLLISSVFYVIKPLFIIYYLNYTVAGLESLPEEKIKILLSLGLLYIICGVIFFYFGYMSKAGEVLAGKIPVFKKEWREQQFWLILFAYVSIGFLSYIYLRSLGITGGRAGLVKGENKYAFLGILFLKSALIVWFTGSVVFKNKLLKVGFWLFVPVFSYLILSLGGRGRLVWPLLTCLVISNYLKKRISFKKIIIFIIAGFLTVAVLFDVAFNIIKNKSATNTVSSLPSSHEKSFLIKFMIQRNVDRLDNLLVVINGVGRKLDFQYGKTFLSLPLKFFPDAFKDSVGINAESGQYLFMKTFYPAIQKANVGFPITYMGELYLNFHILGIAFGMFMFGLFSRAMQEYLNKGCGNPANPIFYSLFFVYTPSFVGSDLSHSFIFFSIDTFLLCIAIIFITGKLQWQQQT